MCKKPTKQAGVNRKKKLWLSEQKEQKKKNSGVPGQGGANQDIGRQGRGGRGSNNDLPEKWDQPAIEEKEAASCENF